MTDRTDQSAPGTPLTATEAGAGLRTAMKSLLSIIAGLIVSDMLKATVAAISARRVDDPLAWINGSILIAATIFVVRVLVDNILFYEEAETLPPGRAYISRVFLIVCDLISYGICYAIVLRLQPAGLPSETGAKNPGFVVDADNVAWALGFCAVVELLHTVWCSVALSARPAEAQDPSPKRRTVLKTWRRLSAFSALAWSGVAYATGARVPQSAPPPGSVAVIISIVSVLSALAYLFFMRTTYDGGPPQHVGGQAKATASSRPSGDARAAMAVPSIEAERGIE